MKHVLKDVYDEKHVLQHVL